MSPIISSHPSLSNTNPNNVFHPALKWLPPPGTLSHRKLLAQEASITKYADMILIVEGEEISTLQAIVEVRIPNLCRPETITEMVKKRKERPIPQGNHITLEFKDGSISLETMEHVLDWAYTGSLNLLNMSLEQNLRILLASFRLGTPQLVQLVESHLKQSLGMHNIFPFLKVANELQVTPMLQFAIGFCLKNWSSVASNKQGLDMIGLDLFQKITIEKTQLSSTPLPELKIPEAPSPKLFVDDFRRIRLKMFQPDAVMIFGDKQIPFHRAILYNTSEKFIDYFPKDKASSSSSKKVRQFKPSTAISPEAFSSLLDLIYFGLSPDFPTQDLDVCAKSACEILEHVVVGCELPVVREKCEETLFYAIEPATVVSIFRFTYLKMNEGRINLLVTLRQHCLDVIVEFFSSINLQEIQLIEPKAMFDVLEAMQNTFKKLGLGGLGGLS